MKTIYQIMLGGLFSIPAAVTVTAQTQVKAYEVKSYELEVVNQLTTSTAVVNMPVSQLLNAPGNEALKAFFFPPAFFRSTWIFQ